MAEYKSTSVTASLNSLTNCMMIAPVSKALYILIYNYYLNNTNKLIKGMSNVDLLSLRPGFIFICMFFLTVKRRKVAR